MGVLPTVAIDSIYIKQSLHVKLIYCGILQPTWLELCIHLILCKEELNKCYKSATIMIPLDYKGIRNH